MSTTYTRTYWMAQALGWVLFGFISMFASYVDSTLSIRSAAVLLLAVASGLLLTHGVRAWMVANSSGMRIRAARRKWLLFIIPAAAAVQALLQFAWQYFFLHDFNWNTIQTGAFFYAAVNWLVIFTVWTALYMLYRYMEKGRQTEIRELKLRALQNEMELTQLKSQLNPHFLFNSLNTMRALVNENPTVAREAITRLSEMLRQTFVAGKKDTITLEEEINLVRDYLSLEKFRFEERLKVEYDIDNGCLSILVPPFMVQTMAENAIKHGVSALTEGGKIRVVVNRQNDIVRIEIRNTGKLMPRKQTSTGIGWENTRKRLDLVYGNQAFFTVKEENDEVVCLFQIPFRKNASAI